MRAEVSAERPAGGDPEAGLRGAGLLELSPALQELKRTVRRLATDRIRPAARGLDTGEVTFDDAFATLREAELLGLGLPEACGGQGAGTLGLVLAVEEVAKWCQASALMLVLPHLVARTILLGGTPEQQQQWVPRLASGELRASFALSEPDAGSWVAGQATRATAVDGGYRISGRKCWISGAPHADVFVVFARSGPGEGDGSEPFSAFVVPAGAEGLSIGPPDRKLGVKGVPTADVVLDGVLVPGRDRIGPEGGAFKLVMRTLNGVRPVVAARGLGTAQGALMYAVEYAASRVIKGATLDSFQGQRWAYANWATEIEAARLLTYRAASLVDAGRFELADAPYLSMAKLKATELAVQVANWSVQALGAAGYMQDHPVEMYLRDARQLTIVEGTSEVQLDLVGQGVVRRDVWW